VEWAIFAFSSWPHSITPYSLTGNKLYLLMTAVMCVYVNFWNDHESKPEPYHRKSGIHMSQLLQQHTTRSGYSPIYFIHTGDTDCYRLGAAATFDLIQPANGGRALCQAGNAIYCVSWHSYNATFRENITRCRHQRWPFYSRQTIDQSKYGLTLNKFQESVLWFFFNYYYMWGTTY